MTDPRMTPTNDAPVTVEQCDRERAADLVIADGGQHDRAKLIRSGSHDEAPTVQSFARHRHAALASAPAVDEERAYRLGWLRATNPNGWHEDDDITHGDVVFDRQMRDDLESDYPRDDAASAPAGDGVWHDFATAPGDGSRVDLWVIFPGKEGSRYTDCYWDDAWSDWRIGQYVVGQFDPMPTVSHWMRPPASPFAALARPRAAVGEREEWELPDLGDLHRDIERLCDYDLGNDRMSDLLRGAMDMLAAADLEYAALQSPPAKVEG